MIFGIPFVLLITFFATINCLRRFVICFNDFCSQENNINFFGEINTFLSDVLRCLELNNTYYETDVTSRQNEMDRLKKYIGSKYSLNTTTKYACWAGFCGPWTDEIWIQTFYNLPSSEFGIFVPVFFNWNRYFLVYRKQRTHYLSILNEIGSLLKPTFLYFTVSYHEAGIEGDTNQKILPLNLFVANAGGKGNMPIMMRSFENYPIGNSNQLNYKYDLVFMGSIHTHKVRSTLLSHFQKLSNFSFYNGKSKDWRTIFQDSKAILCPRGYGRNTFRLTEVLELGLIPIIVYDDIIYVPYYNSIKWEDFSLIVQINLKNNISEIDKIADFVNNLTSHRINAMRNKIRSMYHSHFSRNGSLTQLRRFLKGGFQKSDLRCVKRLYYP